MSKNHFNGQKYLPFYCPIDNHKSHYIERAAFADQNIEPLFLPRNASFMNPIERIWSVVKNQWAKRLLSTGGTMTI